MRRAAFLAVAAVASAAEPEVFRGALAGVDWVRKFSDPVYLERVLEGELLNNVESYRHQGGTRFPKMTYTERREHSQVGYGELLARLRSPAQADEPCYVADCEIGAGAAPATACLSERAARTLLADVGGRVPAIPGLAGGGRDAAVRLFFGNWSTTMFHFDGNYDALIAQVHGAKRVVVAPPAATAAIGSHPDVGACRFGVASELGRGSAWSPDYALEAPGAFAIDLRPGDALFMPRFWWHAVYGDVVPPGPPGVTVSFFYDRRPDPDDARDGDAKQVECQLASDEIHAAATADDLEELRAARGPGERTTAKRRLPQRRDTDRRFRRGRDVLPGV